MKLTLNKKHSLALAVAAAINGISGTALAQSTAPEAEAPEVIEVTGIRTALASALAEKRSSANIKEIIQAEDIGKLPDNNLAEVLENVTGVQIDRTNGVGTGVFIRGTDANRVEINGVSSVTSGSNRTGISFQDLPAALISSLEVTKASTAKTVEGSVGGTINLRTLRGNSLKEQLFQFRVQAENSDLADSTVPRLSATYGDNWQTDLGKFGVVVTGSYAQQDVASANPRFDRDRVNAPGSSASSEAVPFLRTQFLDQPLNAQDFETKNITTSFELQRNENLKFYFDATLNDQEEATKNSRALISGTGENPVINATTNTGFETIDLGTVDGRFGRLNLGEVEVVTSGILGVGVNADGRRIDPNLRTGNNTNSRLTKSNVFAFGSEWTTDNFKIDAEISYSDSKTDNPGLNTDLDFINPRGPQVSAATNNDNGTPAIFNIANNTFEFGIAPGLPETPTTQELLDPANYALRRVSQGLRTREGSEAAARVDISYDVSEGSSFFTDLNAGIRWNKTTNTTNNSTARTDFGNWNRPRANLFADIVTPGANNFGDVDNRTLFISDYLILDPDLSFSNPQAVIDSLNRGIAANNALAEEELNGPINGLENIVTSFFDIDEDTTALYVQGDFESELNDTFITGNVGFRYVSTSLTSLGTSEIDGVVTERVETADYDFVLPRLNISAELTEEVILRLGVGKDIRRPNFDALSTSANFGAAPTAAVLIGNPSLEPEQVWSYDLSLEYYMSDSSFVSIGFFHKDRTDLITRVEEQPAEPIGATGQIERDTTEPCEGGGVYNPNVPWEAFNVFSSVQGVDGICVARRTNINASGSETQTGVELAAQYDLSAFEDKLGWASGFGVIANYTYQRSGESLDEFRNGSADINALLGRTDTDGSTATLADDVVTQRVTLPGLSENAYNFTLFYDKHDLSVRMRYTYRDAFNEVLNRMRFNLPPIVGARGQLNMSASYDINEKYTVGLEGVNLTREDRTRWCFNENTLLCEQSLTDRRITLSLTGKL